MREEVNTEQGTAKKKSEIPPFYEARRKRRKACQIFCAAVAQRYLLVHARITFASGKISPPKGRHGLTSKIQNGKSNHIRPDMEAWFRRAHQRRSRTSETTRKHRPQKSGTYHKNDNGDGGLARKCSIAMRSSCHCPYCMMMKRNPAKNQDFQGFLREYR